MRDRVAGLGRGLNPIERLGVVGFDPFPFQVGSSQPGIRLPVASGGGSGRRERAAAPRQGTNSGCFGSPTVTSTIPSDMAGLTNQNDANCFAWQQFIALNWPANPTTCAADTSVGPAQFGSPGSTATVVWETYKESTEIFQPHATPPADWCSRQPLPAALKAGGSTAGLMPTSPGPQTTAMSSSTRGSPSRRRRCGRRPIVKCWLMQRRLA